MCQIGYEKTITAIVTRAAQYLQTSWLGPDFEKIAESHFSGASHQHDPGDAVIVNGAVIQGARLRGGVEFFSA